MHNLNGSTHFFSHCLGIFLRLPGTPQHDKNFDCPFLISDLSASKTITTLEEYDQLKADESRDSNTAYVIEAGIVADLFADVPLFANASITFKDEWGNYVRITGDRELICDLTHGPGIYDALVQVPVGFRKYTLHVWTVSMDDFKAVARLWTAERIELTVDCEPNANVVQRITALSMARGVLKFKLSPMAQYNKVGNVLG